VIVSACEIVCEGRGVERRKFVMPWFFLRSLVCALLLHPP
jgi:hypothetical protein